MAPDQKAAPLTEEEVRRRVSEYSTAGVEAAGAALSTLLEIGQDRERTIDLKANVALGYAGAMIAGGLPYLHSTATDRAGFESILLTLATICAAGAVGCAFQAFRARGGWPGAPHSDDLFPDEEGVEYPDATVRAQRIAPLYRLYAKSETVRDLKVSWLSRAQVLLVASAGAAALVVVVRVATLMGVVGVLEWPVVRTLFGWCL